MVPEKYFSYMNIYKNSFDYCGSTQPPGAMIFMNLNMPYVRKLSHEFSFSGAVVLEKKIFKIFFLYKQM
jgi:hypothetical protein